MRYQFIDEQKKAWPVRLMCRMFGISQSGYYDCRMPTWGQVLQSHIKDKRKQGG